MTGIENLCGTFESLSLQDGEETNTLGPLPEPLREENILNFDENHNNNNKINKQQFLNSFSPIIDMIDKKGIKFAIKNPTEKNPWENQFKTSAEDVLLKFFDSHHIFNEETYVEIMNLALDCECWNGQIFCNRNIKPKDGIFREIGCGSSNYVYESNVADKLRIRQRICFKFKDVDGFWVFEINGIVDEEIHFKSGKIVPMENGSAEVDKIIIYPNDSFARNGLKALYEVEKSNLIEILFPKTEKKGENFLTGSFNFFNEKLNPEQTEAVLRILSTKSPHPFIIFGPPGTGKSKTMCEAIKQVWENSPGMN